MSEDKVKKKKKRKNNSKTNNKIKKKKESKSQKTNNNQSKKNNKSKNNDKTTKNNIDKKNNIKTNQDGFQNKKNKLFYFFILIIIIVLLFNISYSFFNYTRTGSKNELIVGKIYMDYVTSKTISLQGVLPRSDLDNNTYIEFNIGGINKYEKDIIYAIDLVYGDVPSGKLEENRIRDDLLRFTLTKSVDGGEEEAVLENKSFNDLNNCRIYVEKISKNTSVSVNHNYKLYMWISDSINIGNTLDADYTLEEWNNLFASIKIKVVGDFEEKGVNNTIKVELNPNGGIVNPKTLYYEVGDIYGELPIPTKDGYEFLGWKYNNREIKSTDLVADENAAFVLNDDYEFDGATCIDTGMKPFMENTWNKNFYIAFDITEDNSTVGQSTLVNAKLEDQGRGYPGFVFRRTSNIASNLYELSANINSSLNRRESNISGNTTKVELIRLNNKLYSRFNDGNISEFLDFTRFTNYFDTPVTIGCSMTSDGEYQRYFKGTLSHIAAQYIADDATLDDFLNHLVYSSGESIVLEANWEKTRYILNGEVEFDGTNYIDTGIYLFNESNWQRNFYMSFEILENNSSSSEMATIMSAKYEAKAPYQGVELRQIGSSNKNNYRSKACRDSTSTGFNDVNTIPIATTTKVRYIRINNVLYYSLNGSTTFTPMQDFTGFTLYFDLPVTFGVSLINMETPQRYFTGTLANIRVEFIGKNATLADYENEP